MDLKDLERIRKEQAVRTTWKSVWRGMEERSNFRNIMLCTILIVLLVGLIYGGKEMRFVFESASDQAAQGQVSQTDGQTTQATKTDESP